MLDSEAIFDPACSGEKKRGLHLSHIKVLHRVCEVRNIISHTKLSVLLTQTTRLFENLLSRVKTHCVADCVPLTSQGLASSDKDEKTCHFFQNSSCVACTINLRSLRTIFLSSYFNVRKSVEKVAQSRYFQLF